MAEVINMPRLRQVGDTVEEGDILAEIETDKATMEFESFYEGTLLHVGIKEGETAKVDVLLAIIGEKDEDISGLLSGNDTAAAKEDSAVSEPAIKEVVEAKNAPAAIPDGVTVVTMPRLSDTMEEGTVATWLKAIGDTVEEGDILAEIETDKATMEFESFYSGTLLHIGIKEGESANVDALLAIIGGKGTDVSGVIANYASGAPATAASKKEAMPQKKETPKPAPQKEETVKTVTTNNNGSERSGGRIFASPLAKKMAEEKGINLAQVKGSGENGRIIKKDIENYTPTATVAGDVPSFVPTGEESFEEITNSQMRKAIARSLSKSK